MASRSRATLGVACAAAYAGVFALAGAAWAAKGDETSKGAAGSASAHATAQAVVAETPRARVSAAVGDDSPAGARSASVTVEGRAVTAKTTVTVRTSHSPRALSPSPPPPAAPSTATAALSGSGSPPIAPQPGRAPSSSAGAAKPGAGAGLPWRHRRRAAARARPRPGARAGRRHGLCHRRCRHSQGRAAKISRAASPAGGRLRTGLAWRGGGPPPAHLNAPTEQPATVPLEQASSKQEGVPGLDHASSPARTALAVLLILAGTLAIGLLLGAELGLGARARRWRPHRLRRPPP